MIITLLVIVMFDCSSVKVKILLQRPGHECGQKGPGRGNPLTVTGPVS